MWFIGMVILDIFIYLFLIVPLMMALGALFGALGMVICTVLYILIVIGTYIGINNGDF